MACQCKSTERSRIAMPVPKKDRVYRKAGHIASVRHVEELGLQAENRYIKVDASPGDRECGGECGLTVAGWRGLFVIVIQRRSREENWPSDGGERADVTAEE